MNSVDAETEQFENWDFSAVQWDPSLGLRKKTKNMKITLSSIKVYNQEECNSTQNCETTNYDAKTSDVKKWSIMMELLILFSNFNRTQKCVSTIFCGEGAFGRPSWAVD